MTERNQYCLANIVLRVAVTVGGGSNSLPDQLFDQMKYLKNVF
jgi:hypothetical protein